MRVVVNAQHLRPGGGETALLSIVRSLMAVPSGPQILVLCDDTQVARAVGATTSAEVLEVPPTRSHAGLAFPTGLWRLIRLLHDLPSSAVISFNHYLFGLPCPQIVYHLNLLRFRSALDPSSARLNCRAGDRVRDFLARAALKRAAANIFESRYLADVALKSTAASGPTAVSYIGLPDELVNLAPTIPSTYGGEPTLVAIQSPSEHKDNPTLLRTLKTIIQIDPVSNWTLDIAGGTDQQEWAPIRQMAVQLGILDRITWHGYCGQQFLDQLLRRSLCLLSTSRVESFAQVPLEAMARRCPPITTNLPAMPESVGRGGIMVEAGNARAFAAAVLELRRNPIRREELVIAGLDHIRNYRSSCGGQVFSRIFAQIESRQNSPQRASA